MAEPGKNEGIIVTAAGTGINLALGVLYAWSIFKGAIKESIHTKAADSFQWDPASLNDPYAACCIVFACVMIVAGGIQDKYGPRITALIGGLMIGTGFVWMSQTSAYLSWVLAFGVLVGSGIAFAYSATTPAALKWFHQSKSGMISGIVVAGFGLAPVYIAPLAQYLLNAHGIRNSMMIFGFSFFIVISLLALFLKNPPAGFSPPGSFAEKRSPDRQGVRTKFQSTHAGPTEIIRQPFFWLLWILFFIGAGAGLMVIGSVAGMAKASMGQNAFIAVAIMAIGNAGGRIAAGMLSDKIGRKLTLLAIIGFQALLMFAAIPLTSSTFSSPAIIVILAALMGFNYGANLALFPSYAKDLWGMKSFGMNYGILFTAWGFGGLVMSRFSESLAAKSGSFRASFIAAGILLSVGTVIILFMRDKKEEMRQELRRQQVAQAIS
jgi:MFS family permease